MGGGGRTAEREPGSVVAWGALDYRSLSGSTLPPVTMARHHFSSESQENSFLSSLDINCTLLAILNRLSRADPPHTLGEIQTTTQTPSSIPEGTTEGTIKF